MLKNGLAAPLSWYKAMVSGIATEDDKCTHLPISIFPQRYRTCQIGVQLSIDIPQERLVIHYPVFFGGSKQDYVNITALALIPFTGR